MEEKGDGKMWWVIFIESKAGPFANQNEARDWIADIIHRYGKIDYKIRWFKLTLPVK